MDTQVKRFRSIYFILTMKKMHSLMHSVDRYNNHEAMFCIKMSFKRTVNGPWGGTQMGYYSEGCSSLGAKSAKDRPSFHLSLSSRTASQTLMKLSERLHRTIEVEKCRSRIWGQAM